MAHTVDEIYERNLRALEEHFPTDIEPSWSGNPPLAHLVVSIIGMGDRTKAHGTIVRQLRDL